MLEKPHTFIQPTAPDKPAKERERMREGERERTKSGMLTHFPLKHSTLWFDTYTIHLGIFVKHVFRRCLSGPDGRWNTFQEPRWPCSVPNTELRSEWGFPLPAPKAIRICPENPEKFFISSITNENAFSYFVRSLFQVLLTRYWLLYCIYKPNVKRNHKK